ncbi:MAG TPA: T9SS type A sorting domain-containing protein [Bacteroidia bacterium]|nr:T9SS type A sorting domain-containing protein [Bacteroidia bacterium]
MKKLQLITAIIFLSASAQAQNLPACDSLIINCCTFTANPPAFTIQVSNYSSVLFDYPGFVLFDSNMDTIAKETVTYFGISVGPQPHTLNIVAPLVLPFTGFLNLYTWFYDSLACSFPFTIPDTITGINNAVRNRRIKIFPNPASGKAIIEAAGFSEGQQYSLEIFNVLGKTVYHKSNEHFPLQLLLDKINPDIYFIRISCPESNMQATQKLIVQGKEKF